MAALLSLMPATAKAQADMMGMMPDFSPDMLMQLIQGMGNKQEELSPVASSLVGADGATKPLMHTDPNTIFAFAAENFPMATQGASMATKGIGAGSSYSSLGMGIVQNIVRIGQQKKPSDTESSFASQKEGGGAGGAPTLAQAHEAAIKDAILRVNARTEEPAGLIECQC